MWWLLTLFIGAAVGFTVCAMLSLSGKVDEAERAYWRGFTHGVMQHEHDNLA